MQQLCMTMPGRLIAALSEPGPRKDALLRRAESIKPGRLTLPPVLMPCALLLLMYRYVSVFSCGIPGFKFAFLFLGTGWVAVGST